MQENIYNTLEQANGKEETKAISPILPTSISQLDESQTYNFHISLSSTYTWTLATASKWIQLSTVEGQGSATVTCTVKALSGLGIWRTGEIVFVYTSPSITKKVTIPVTQSGLIWPVGGSQYKAGTTRTAEDKGNGKYSAKGSVITGYGAVSSFYGARFTSTNSEFYRHWAIDIDVDDNNTETEAYAAMSGKVVKTGTNHRINGNYVYLGHTFTDSANKVVTLYTRYLHLKKINSSIKTESSVKVGAPIGIVGSTGSAGEDAHLHFAVLKKLSSTMAYYLNPVAYYHGSDDRGVKSGNALKKHANNPMFILDGKEWAVNPSFDPFYKSFQSVSDQFFTDFLNAKRNGTKVETASTSV